MTLPVVKSAETGPVVASIWTRMSTPLLKSMNRLLHRLDVLLSAVAPAVLHVGDHCQPGVSVSASDEGGNGTTDHRGLRGSGVTDVCNIPGKEADPKDAAEDALSEPAGLRSSNAAAAAAAAAAEAT